MVVPLVVLNKWLTAPGDGMFRKFFNGGDPVGIHRPVSFKIATHTLEHYVPCLSLGNFHPIMQTYEANSAIDQFLKALKVLHNEVTPATITEDYDTIDPVKRIGLLGPPLVLGCLETQTTCFQRRGKHRIALHVIVSLTVFPTVREKHDLLLFGEGSTGGQQGD